MAELTKFGPIQGVIKFWSSLNGTQRFITAAFIVTSVLLLVVVTTMATRPRMAVLFSGLESQDSGAIVAKLQESKVDYDIDGSAIKVPANKVHELRMQLANDGLPKGSTVGFELFDKTNFGATEFTQRLNYQRALQGELSRTINEISGVMESRVHIAIPEQTVFTEQRREPSASVVLKLAPGAGIDDNNASGIVHLVSSAVEGLKPEQVTVVDTSGNILSQASDGLGGIDPRMNDTQMKLKRAYERQVEQSVQTMLEPVLGPGKSVVRANARINFDRTEINSETYQPVEANTGVLTSQQQMSETYNGSGGPSGAMGGAARLSGTTQPRSASGTRTAGGGYQRTETTAKYEVSKTIEHTIKAPGQIEKLSVAVLVNGKPDEAKMPIIQSAVTAAAGIDPARGDEITVESVAFDDSAAKAEEKEMKAIVARTSYLAIGKTVGGVVVLFLFLFLLKGMLKQVKISIPEPLVEQEVRAQAVDRQVEQSQPARTFSAVNIAQAEPESVANTLRAWMSEGRN